MTIELKPSPVEKSTAAEGIPDAEPVGFEPERIIAQQAAARAVAQAQEPENEHTSETETQAFGRGNTTNASSLNQDPARNPIGVRPDHLGRILSGLVGGIVALAGTALLQWGGFIPSPPANIAAIEQEIADLKSAQQPGLDEARLAEFDGAVTNAKDALNRVASIEGDVVTLKQQAAAGNNTDNGAVDKRIETLEAQLAASQQKADQAASAVAGEAEASATLTSRIDALESKINDSAGGADIAAAMAATGLKAAIDRGGPFAPELDTYLAVAPQPELDALRPLAVKGIPTVSQLSSQFSSMAAGIIASTQTPDPNAGVLGRLWASAGSLVKQRPVGLVEGDGVDAIVSRIEAQLKAGDIDAAIAEWEKLPENARAAAGGFAHLMHTRQNADAVVAKALSGALTGIKSSNAGK